MSQCAYVYTRGQRAGVRCRNQTQIGSDRCRTCQAKGGAVPRVLTEKELLAELTAHPDRAIEVLNWACRHNYQRLLEAIPALLRPDDAEKAYRIAFARCHDITFLDRLWNRGLPFDVYPALLDLSDAEPRAMEWFIRHAPSRQLVELDFPVVMGMFSQGGLTPSDVRRVLMHEPAESRDAATWKTWLKYFTWPPATAEQLEWIPVALYRQLIRRQATVRGALRATLPPDLVKYISQAL